MKIITCASYYGSGSSALTDLVAEYDNVKDLSDFEFRFLHDMDGIRDLEYYLVENHNRHNSGHALKRFARLSRFNEGNFLSKRYSQFFEGDEFHTITAKYIEELTDFVYQGWWFYDLYDKGSRKYYLYQIINHFLRRIPGNHLRILKNEKTICSHPSESKFLECTQDYVSSIIHALNKEKYEFLEVDQIAPSSNIESIMRYFKDELFVFIVDRDPRDVYLCEKYVWHEYVCPSDPDLFCKWYKYAREAGTGVPSETDHIKKLQFEDLIYRYDETVSRIEKTTGLNPAHHSKQYSKLNPKRSISNTRMWEKYPNDSGLTIIEKKLSNFLYDYSDIGEVEIKGIDVKDNSSF